MNEYLPQRPSDDRFLRHSYDLLLAVSQAQSHFIADADPREVFGEILTAVLSHTQSEYGFLGEVVRRAPEDAVLHLHAASDIAWDQVYLDAVFSSAIRTGQRVMFADPPDAKEGQRASAIRTFLGLPIELHGEAIGVLGIANRPNGYDSTLVTLLEPFLATYGMLLEAFRTDQRRQLAEKGLRESDERFRMMADASPVMIWVSDVDKRCTYFNKRWRDFTGRSLEQELGDGWAEGVHPDDLQPCLHTYGASFDAREPFQMEYRLRRFDGAYRWVLDEGTPRYLPDGEFSGFVGSAIDITDRKLTEESLRKSDERFQLALRATQDVIFDWDMVGGSLWWNEQAKTRYGYSPDEGRYDFARWIGLVHPVDRDRVTSLMDAVIEGGRRLFDVEYRLRCADGSYAYVHERGFIVRDENGKPLRMIGSLTDITERKRGEEAQRRSESALRESEAELRLLAGKLLSAQEAERSALARELHDDVSQRLAALAIETSMLEANCRAVPQSVPKRLRDIRDGLVNLSTDVHDLSRQLHPAIVRDLGLPAAIQAECSRFSEREGIGAEFVGHDVPDMPAEVAVCLYRIVQEGLRNIAKHAQAKDVLVTLDTEDQEVVLSIQDSGEGFDPAVVRSSGGLGLASMRERAWLVRGTIVIRSRPGQGTRIEVRVPAERVRA